MAESEDDGMQIKIDQLLDLTLNICASIIKVNLRGTEELAHILKDLGLTPELQQPIQQVFKAHYLDRLDQINNVYEDPSEQGNWKFSKKFPLNMSLADEALAVQNPRLVDVSWEVIHTLTSKNLNKIFEPRFQITLTMLTQQGGALQQGATSYIQWSSKRNALKLKRVTFECDQTELTHMIQKVKQATNSLEQINKPHKK